MPGKLPPCKNRHRSVQIASCAPADKTPYSYCRLVAAYPCRPIAFLVRRNIPKNLVIWFFSLPLRDMHVIVRSRHPDRGKDTKHAGPFLSAAVMGVIPSTQNFVQSPGVCPWRTHDADRVP